MILRKIVSNKSTRSHPDTWLEIDELGLVPREYRPTFTLTENELGGMHQRLANSPLKDGILLDTGVPGWLTVSEALKLSEMAYFLSGNILEFGTHRGLSTTIMAEAMSLYPQGALLKYLGRSPKQRHIVTVDLDPEAQSEAEFHIAKRGLSSYVRFVREDAEVVAHILTERRKKFNFCFVDHAHAFEPMIAICRQLSNIVTKDGFVMFHDFNNNMNTRRKNVGESNTEYGVYAAVEEGLDKNRFTFYGIYGSSAL